MGADNRGGFGAFLDEYRKRNDEQRAGGVLPSFALQQVDPLASHRSDGLAEEVARLREAVEELVYWVRPMTGNLVTGKAAVEEFERLTGERMSK